MVLQFPNYCLPVKKATVRPNRTNKKIPSFCEGKIYKAFLFLSIRSFHRTTDAWIFKDWFWFVSRILEKEKLTDIGFILWLYNDIG
jgi:hypothetical protein